MGTLEGEATDPCRMPTSAQSFAQTLFQTWGSSQTDGEQAKAEAPAPHSGATQQHSGGSTISAHSISLPDTMETWGGGAREKDKRKPNKTMLPRVAKTQAQA